jgi:hypothetical protein
MTNDFELSHSCGVSLSRTLTEDALLVALPGAASSRRDTRTGWVWYQLPTLQDGDYVIGVGLGFNRGLLEAINFTDTNPKFGTHWNQWSQEQEQLRAKSTESWLKSKGITAGSYSWGRVWAGFDDRGGWGGAKVRLAITCV